MGIKRVSRGEQNPGTVEAAVRLVEAFSDPVRLRLIHLLTGREVCVCHLNEALRLPRLTVSRRLGFLRRAGIIESRREEHWVYYRLAEPSSDLHRDLLDAITPNVAALDVMKADLDRLSLALAERRLPET